MLLERAFVLITTVPGAEREIANSLRLIENVRDVHAVYGLYDIIALLEAQSLDEIRNTVTSEIRKIEKISSTLTLICVEEKESVLILKNIETKYPRPR